jgi:hypothetical protein
MQNIMKIDEFQGSDIVDTPELPGIYAWYYRPPIFGNREAEILGKLITNPSRVKTEIALRYGLMWTTDSDVDVLYGTKRQPADKIVLEAVAGGGDLVESFFKSLMLPYFAKPLYIGRSENLYQRVYKEHYVSLTELWELDTPVSKYLAGHPDATVKEVIEQLNLPHSFAVEARVKGLRTGDLRVCVCQIEISDSQAELRRLEQILQLLADPICGRR